MEPLFTMDEIEGLNKVVEKGVEVGMELEHIPEDSVVDPPLPHPPSIARTYMRLKGKKKVV